MILPLQSYTNAGEVLKLPQTLTRMTMHISIKNSLDTQGLRVGIVASRFNLEVCDLLLKRCLDELVGRGVLDQDIVVLRVSGALEIPYALRQLYESKFRVDGLIALGAVIRGETYHFELVANESARKISEIAEKIPVANGVLTCDNMQQALARVDTKAAECAHCVIELVELRSSIEAAYVQNEGHT